MKKYLFLFMLLAVSALLTGSMVMASSASRQESKKAVKAYRVQVNEHDQIISMSEVGAKGASAWRIRDTSGPTNIRNKPSGSVCMKLKAYTEYVIYAGDVSDYAKWIKIYSIYNETEDREVKLHGSKTGYWIHRSVVYLD